MSDPFVTELHAISTPGTSAAAFFKKLGPLHARWHTANNHGTQSIGFLLFHWELLQRFKAVGGPQHFGGVTPFTKPQFSTFGQPYNVSTHVGSNQVSHLEEFSSDVEAWHNDAHMAVSMAFHINLMNPKTNIRLVQFWQLHYFINDRFEEKLVAFKPATAVPAVISQIEASTAIALV
jgi:hypothetical protein